MTVKRFMSVVLLILLALSLVYCGSSEHEEISCAEIVASYEAAGYTVSHSQHHDEDFPYECTVNAHKGGYDHVYFYFYWTEGAAKDAAEVDEYNVATWIFALSFGEYRWLRSGTYGRIEYSCYNTDLIKPFQELVKQKNK